jgi:kynureninase
VELTNYMLPKLECIPKVKILTPYNENERGSHISILIENTDMKIFKEKLSSEGIYGDLRRFEDESYLMRISPIGLYNT